MSKADSKVMADVWASGVPEFARRFSDSMKKCCADFPDDFSAAVKAAWKSDPELCAEFGAVKSARLKKLFGDNPELLAKFSARMKAAMADPAVRKKRGAISKALWADPNYRAKHNAGMKARDPAYREKQGAALKARWADPEKGEKLRSSRTDPSYRAKQSAGVKVWADKHPKTHCKHGHLLSADNLYFRSRGGRECRACVKARSRTAYHVKAMRGKDAP